MAQEIKTDSGEILIVREIPKEHKIKFLAKSLEGDKFYVVHEPNESKYSADY